MSSFNLSFDSANRGDNYNLELDKLAQEPKELLKIFENSFQNKIEMKEGEIAAFDAFLAKISQLNASGKLDAQQVKKVAKISASIYPSIKSMESTQNITTFLHQTLEPQNAYSYLKIALRTNDVNQINNCLILIPEMKGITLGTTGKNAMLQVDFQEMEMAGVNKLLNVLKKQFSNGTVHFEITNLSKVTTLESNLAIIEALKKEVAKSYPEHRTAMSLSPKLLDQSRVQNEAVFEKLAQRKSTVETPAIKEETFQALKNFSVMIDACYATNDAKGLEQLKQQVASIEEALKKNPALITENFTNEEQGELHQQIDDIAHRVADKYLDEYRLLKGAPRDKPIHPSFQQWHLTEAILHEKMENLTPVQQKYLEHLILQSFRKAAGFHEAKDLNVQTSPLFAQQRSYSRHETFKITENCYAAYAKDIGINEKLFVLHSPLVMEAIRRQMPDRGGFSLAHMENAEDLFENMKGFTELIDPNGDDTIVIDISKLLENEKIPPSKITDTMKTLEEMYKKYLDKNGKSFDSKAKWLQRTQFVALTKHKEQDVLLMPKFFDRCNSGYIELNVINYTGFRLSPAQTIEAWLKIEDTQTILKRENISLASLATQGTAFPKVYENYQQFIATQAVQKFAALVNDPPNLNGPPLPPHPTYVKVLANSTTALLNGLKNLNIDGRTKDGKYEGLYPEEMNEMLQVSYFRIINALSEATLRRYNYRDFHNQIELVHQEIQNILSLAKPYQEGHNVQDGDFAKSVLANLAEKPVSKDIIDPAIIPTNFTPKVHLKNSGMHAIASVVASVEAQKINVETQKKGSQQLNTMVLKDSYFESSEILLKGKDYTTHVLEHVGDTYNFELKAGDIANAKKPIDLFLCEIHHNVGIEKTDYKTENIAEQIKFLKNNNMLAPNCTVAIDTTINFDRSDDVRTLLADPEIAKMITDGELNIVLLRSAQKFDMLGLDNYYGGVATTINNGKSFPDFDERMNHPQDQLTGLNYQGLTHLQKYGDLDSYRKAVHENTKKLYAQLPKELFEGIEPFVKIATMEEDCQYFLGLMFPGGAGVSRAFINRFLEFAKDQKVLLTNRSSFGFANTNIVHIDGGNVRLTLGLDDEKTINLYADFFKAFAQLAYEASQKQRNEMIPDANMPMIFRTMIQKMPSPS